MSTSQQNRAKLAEILKDLNKPRGELKKMKFKTGLFPAQAECLSSIFKDNKKTVFMPCGRKFSKTHTASYALWRNALTKPNTANYYIAPEKTHARELIWKNNRLQKFLGPDSDKYISKIQDREMTIRFKNGSFITLLGSDNWMAANGLTPDFVVYDEFKGFKPQFHIEMAPNLIAKNAPLLIIGTQPKVGDQNKEQYEIELDFAKNNPDICAVHTYTTFDNPINMQPDNYKRIMDEIAKLKASGQNDVVEREYYSRIVPGGSNAIFPSFSEELHVEEAISLRKELDGCRKDLRWIVACDPATSSTFAVLLMAINKVNKHVYLVDEIYEKKQSEISVSKIWPRIQSMVNKHCLEDRYNVQYVSDEREGLFISEVRDQFKQTVFPTRKHLYKKHNGITLIRDLMLFEMIHISNTCQNMIKEIIEYSRDSKGNIAKINDHLVDTLRYGLGQANYTVAIPDQSVRTREILPGIHESVERPDSSIKLEENMDIGSDFKWEW